MKAKGTLSSVVYRRIVPRLGHARAIGAITHRLCRLMWKIQAEHTARLGQFMESVWSTKGVTVQFLKPDIAIVHVTWGMRGGKDPDGTPRPPREGLFTWVVVQEGGDWLVRAAQNTNRGNLPSPPMK